MKARGSSAGKIESDAKRNIYQIGGMAVDFPHKAYGSQLAFMGRVISTLDRAQKQGHSHALLESPTGTGKTLSLLCSTLAWQKCYSSRYAQTHAGIGGSDPFVHGGGFIHETETPREILYFLAFLCLYYFSHLIGDFVQKSRP